ncbi:MAG: IS630 family transposase [Candidatus Poribacteria bacterium]|nr:IS630 family transposase [Candidatus Poribacteria bacterium]
MIRISFTEEKIKALDDEPSHHHHPRVQKKMEALWLKSRGLSHGEIAPLTSISPNTLPAYLSQYLEGRIEALKIVNFGQHPATTIKQAAAKIKELIGIKCRQNRIRLFLKLISLKRYKVGTQLRPVKKELQPPLEEATTGGRALFFVDIAHFVPAPFLGFLGSLIRIFIRAPAGRKRFNVFGALNAITDQLITVTNKTHIKAESVGDLLCQIEGFWKFLPKKCLYSKYDSEFSAFKNAIIDCLSQTYTSYKQELDS